ncbi:putative sorting nexin-16 [Apostichopus japonicus]|uniref:Putative sorting nexin-16 n=1 Tax=Stichopus japonicus TaxID=307972 RepID=A0A2G8K626_STIJA|nr:putative sorting nexin-16 [Apostichopus japonicus]
MIPLSTYTVGPLRPATTGQSTAMDLDVPSIVSLKSASVLVNPPHPSPGPSITYPDPSHPSSLAHPSPTVFKLHVQKNANESWFIFRRFTDFERLNSQLAYLFPNFRLALPPKKWFGNNFDPMFLEDRQLGLQAFLNNICGHKDIVISDCVREFLCVDDPPGPHDSLEESRALCESLEETVYNLKREVAERDRKILTLTEELSNATRRIESLTMQQMIPNDRVLPVCANGSDSQTWTDSPVQRTDQQDYSPEQEEQPIVPSFSDDKGEPAIETTKEESPPVFTSIPLDKSPADTKDAPIISPSEVIQVT